MFRKIIIGVFSFIILTAVLFAGDAQKVRERMKNDPLMIPFYTGSLLPEPQKVAYKKEFYSLRNSGILLGKKLKQNDVRVKLLLERITKYGGEFKFVDSLKTDCPTIIAIEDAKFAKKLVVPKHEEAYVIKSYKKNGKNIIAVRGADKLGLLWAINSLNQMITVKGDDTVIQAFDVEDFPVIKGRGNRFSPYYHDKQRNKPDSVLAAKFLVATCKLNYIVMGASVMTPRRGPQSDWHVPRSQAIKDNIAATGKFLTPLGIQWYAAVKALDFNTPNTIRSKNEQDFKTVFDMAEIVAKAGGGVEFPWEDNRFPIHPDDKRDFGSALKADVYFFTKMYKALKSKYPQFKMIICPPFYWGPIGEQAKYPYPEDGEKYLRALGKAMPKDVGIEWTGPRVKSSKITKKEVARFANLIGRKPCLWQNAHDAGHIYFMHYKTDPIPWYADQRYKGFYNDLDIAFYSGGREAVATMLWSALLWNPDKYDPEDAVKQAVMKLGGPESFETLDKLRHTLAYFDQFDMTVSPMAVKKLLEIEQKLDETEKLIKVSRRYYPAAVKQWLSLEWPLFCIKNHFYKNLKKVDPQKYVKNAEKVENDARREVGIDKDDIFLSPYDFSGGKPAKIYKYSRKGVIDLKPRLCTWIYGKRSPKSILKVPFTVEPFPPAGDYKLAISAVDDDSEKKCKIRLYVNGKPFFEGANPFKRNNWNRHIFTIPAKLITRRTNTLTIENIEDTASMVGPPFFMLNYAVLKKTVK